MSCSHLGSSDLGKPSIRCQRSLAVQAALEEVVDELNGIGLGRVGRRGQELDAVGPQEVQQDVVQVHAVVVEDEERAKVGRRAGEGRERANELDDEGREDHCVDGGRGAEESGGPVLGHSQESSGVDNPPRRLVGGPDLASWSVVATRTRREVEGGFVDRQDQPAEIESPHQAEIKGFAASDVARRIPACRDVEGPLGC